eukprot:8076385-Ditylum_brightwellii.AAC.1
MKYTVKFPNNYQMETTHKFLRPNLPDLAEIPVTKEGYAAESKYLTAEECKKNPKLHAWTQCNKNTCLGTGI